MRIVHFVGFRPLEEEWRYRNAVRVFGPPDFEHRNWDIYAQGDIAPGDTVVFARGDASRAPISYTREAARRRKRSEP